MAARHKDLDGVDLTPYPRLEDGDARVSGAKEGRVRTRVGVEFPARLHSSDFEGPLQAQTRDLGLGGICVATRTPFAYKSIHRVRLELPDGPLVVKAEGRWQRPTRVDEGTLTGIAFLEPSPEATERLCDVLLDQGKLLARFLFSGSDLANIGIDEAMGLAHVSRYRRFHVGESIYRQDQHEHDSVFLVFSGSVVLYVRVRDVIDTPIARIGPGSLFGGLSAVADVPHPESAIADSEVRVLEITRDAFLFLCASRPWLAQRLAETVTQSYARRLQLMMKRVRDAL